jgi:CheY-like chemotaxis protein
MGGPPAAQPNEPPLVLIADDARDNREMYAGYLSENGFRVAEARDGAEAVRLTKQLHPAVVMLDLEMPRMDGIAVTRRIRRDTNICNTPILVLTADDSREQDALKAGANVVCIKPCIPAALVPHIQRLLRQSVE